MGCEEGRGADAEDGSGVPGLELTARESTKLDVGTGNSWARRSAMRVGDLVGRRHESAW